MNIREEAKAILPEVIALRRQFHRHPEMGMHEYETSQFIKDFLKKEEISFQAVGDTGVVGFIDCNREKNIALRADMDALRIQEQSDVPYKSEYAGIMHACGHDAHMACLLGAAKILKKYRHTLPCNVKLIFQPAEENCKGAKLMIDHGVLADVDAIFGLHIFSDIPSGKISIEAGPRMAATDIFRIAIKGSAGHAAKPHQCVDATVAAAASVMNLQTIVSRELNPLSPAVVTVGQLHSGSQYNIISGEAVLEGTVRSFDMDVSKHIQASIERIVRSTAEAYGATAEFEFKPSRHPVVFNDPELAHEAYIAAQRIFGSDQLIHIDSLMLGEDFSSYQAVKPGVFAFVGAYNEKKGCIYPNHHDQFKIDEDALLECVMLNVMFGMKLSI